MTNPPHDPGAAPGFSPSPQAALEFLQKMWNPLGVPIPGFGLPAAAPGATAATPPGPGFPHPAMMFAALDPAEVQRKIDELRVIENWLAMSLFPPALAAWKRRIEALPYLATTWPPHWRAS